MPRFIPPRNYSTFAELMASWQRNEEALRWAIICGALKPSVPVTGKYISLFWDTADAGGGVRKLDLENSLSLNMEYELQGWHYLQDPLQTGPFDCEFKLFSNDRDPGKSETSSSAWYLLQPPMTLDDVKHKAVFLMSEVESYESRFREFGGRSKVEPAVRSLGNAERGTLLKLVIGMAIKGYKHDPTVLKSHAPKEIADDLAELGISITDDTVRKYLKQAVETVLPAKRRQD